MAILELKNLTYQYGIGTPNPVTARDHIDLQVEEGEFVAVIGPTGSGKSTLVQHLNGLLEPTSGTVLVDGRDMWADRSKIREFRFLVGLVFQYPEYQLFEETTYKDIAYGPRNMGLPEDEIDRRVREAAKLVGLRDKYLDKSPFELSGGQKRRAAIAGVMAMEPKVLILDEPTAGLDPKGRDRILDHLRDYHRRKGTTILLVSHSMEDVAKYADKVLVMDHGKVVDYDTATNVFARYEKMTDIGLGVPQIADIFHRLGEKGYKVPTPVLTVEQGAEVLLNLLGGDRNA